MSVLTLSKELKLDIYRCDLNDLKIVDAIHRHPSVYPWIIDDMYSDNEPDGFTNYHALINPDNYYLSFWYEGLPAGVFSFFPINLITYEGHIAILPKFRGKTALKASLRVINWMFENTACRKIVCMIPTYNLKAMTLITRLGFQKEGFLYRSFKKNGVLYNQHIVGINKGEF